MKKSEIIDLLIPLMERGFSVKETLSQLMVNRIQVMSWGINDLTNVQNKGFLFKVQGHHHKGYVFITLSWMDTYTVRIVGTDGTIKNTYENVYCDQLTEIIDNRIERISTYVR
jgi:hypothetical protein